MQMNLGSLHIHKKFIGEKINARGKSRLISKEVSANHMD